MCTVGRKEVKKLYWKRLFLSWDFYFILAATTTLLASKGQPHREVRIGWADGKCSVSWPGKFRGRQRQCRQNRSGNICMEVNNALVYEGVCRSWNVKCEVTGVVPCRCPKKFLLKRNMYVSRVRKLCPLAAPTEPPSFTRSHAWSQAAPVHHWAPTDHSALWRHPQQAAPTAVQDSPILTKTFSELFWALSIQASFFLALLSQAFDLHCH